MISVLIIVIGYDIQKSSHCSQTIGNLKSDFTMLLVYQTNTTQSGTTSPQ